MAGKDFLAALEQSLGDNSFVKLSLGNYKGAEAYLKNIDVRKILIKGAEKLSFTYHYKNRDIVKNYDLGEGVKKASTALRHGFNTANLFTTKFDMLLERGQLKKNPPSNTELPSLDHDKAKKRLVDTKGKFYLYALNVTDAEGNVLKSAQDKYRQIDKYVEIVGGLVKAMPKATVKSVADMGAGKGYLTFALYDYIKNTLGLDVKVTGVEMRPDLVQLCNGIASDSKFGGLRFVDGTIQNYDASGVSILIALHACDTATDDAIAKGIKAGAGLIVVAPCCHKQIRREMEAAKAANTLTPLTRHGIFMERQAEMVTDGIRALLLEYHGYQTKVFEFVGGEHTAKNVMITASKTGKGKNPDSLKKIAELKKFFGIQSHYLEKLLNL